MSFVPPVRATKTKRTDMIGHVLKPIKPRYCECHGSPMTWVFDDRYNAGGYFRCYLRDAETTAAWRKRNPEKAFLHTNNDYLQRKKRRLHDYDPNKIAAG